VGTNFGGPPITCESENRPKIRRDFGRIQTSIANISGMGKISTNGKRRYQLKSLSRSRTKFGELWFTNYRGYAANVYQPKLSF